MAQNANRRASTYAKKSTQAKKKRSLKPRATTDQTAPSPQPMSAPGTISSQTASPQSSRAPERMVQASTPVYTYVISDLKRTAIIAAVLFVALIILSLIL